MIIRDFQPISLDNVIEITLTPNLGIRNDGSVDEIIKRHTLPLSSEHYGIVDAHGKNLMNFIGKLENIDSDWKIIQEKCDIFHPLPRTNTTENFSYKDHVFLSEIHKEKLYE